VVQIPELARDIPGDLPGDLHEALTAARFTYDEVAELLGPVAHAALSRKMVPVLWETGGDISRMPPYTTSAALRQVLSGVSAAPESAAR